MQRTDKLRHSLNTVFLLFILMAFYLSANSAESKAGLAAKIQSVEKLIGAGNYKQALSAANSLAHAYPDNSEIQAKLALAFLYEQDLSKAKERANCALSLDSKNHEAHWVLANIYMTEGKAERSVEEYHLSIKYRPKNACMPCLKNSKSLERKKH